MAQGAWWRGDGSKEISGAAEDGEIQDAVPLEWIRRLEQAQAAKERIEAAERERRRQVLSVVSWVIPGVVFLAVVVTISVLSRTHSPSSPPGLPAEVQSFAKALPASQEPNSSGVSVVDDTDAPNTWRVAWETEDAAFCFAFVHESEPPQTVCDAAGSVATAKMRIGGELSDTGLDPQELFTCGYTTGPDGSGGFVEVDGDEVVGTLTGMGSGLSAYCVQLPDGTAPGGSFTVTTFAATGTDGKGNLTGVNVTATYP